MEDLIFKNNLDKLLYDKRIHFAQNFRLFLDINFRKKILDNKNYNVTAASLSVFFLHSHSSIWINILKTLLSLMVCKLSF